MSKNKGIRVFYSKVFTKIVFETFIKGQLVAKSLFERPIPGVEVVEGTPATDEEIGGVHAAEYLESVRNGGGNARSNGLGWDEGLFPSVAGSTGSLIDAVRWALATRGIAGALSSGLHHARYDRGAGYCVLNGLVIAAVEALKAGAKRVLILDLDAHGGGGTASLIAGMTGIEQVDVSVNTFDSYSDTHNATQTMANGRNYLEVVERALDGIVNPTLIDLVILNMGMDVHEQAGGTRGITTEVVRQREQMVFAWTRANDIPAAFCLAGGYTAGGVTMDELVDLHRITIETAAAAA